MLPQKLAEDNQPQLLPQDDFDESNLLQKNKEDYQESQGKIHTIYTGCTYKRPKLVRYLDSEITSNLSFQKLIYFNVWYSILHFYIYLITSCYRFMTFTESGGQFTWNLLRIIFIFAPWGVVEIFRIQNGYTGNIKESFPEIVSFFLQTLFQIALNFVLAVIFQNRLPIEQPVLIIQIIFNFIELFYCIQTIIKLQKAQSALFFWKSPFTKQKSINKEQVFREYNKSKEKQDLDLRDFDNKLHESRVTQNDSQFRDTFQNTNNTYNRFQNTQQSGFGQTDTFNSFNQTGTGINYQPSGQLFGGRGGKRF